MPKMLGTYHSYNFIDKDPIIDYIRTVINEYGKTLKALSEESGVSATTISNWLYGDTKRPQAAPLNAVLRACNYKLNITKLDVPELIYPTAYQPKPDKPPKPYKPTSIKPTEGVTRAMGNMRYFRKAKTAKARKARAR